VAGGYISGVGQSVVANIVCSAVCAGGVAVGLSQARDFNDPKNWPVWVGLIISFGVVGFVGTGANAARLWWKKRRIRRSSGERLTVVLADLVGDDASRGQKQNVRDSLERYLESSIHIISYPQVVAIDEGHFDAELTKAHAVAQRILNEKRGDLLIWGRVKSANVLALYFTGRSVGTSKVSSYMLVSDAERALELPLNFDRDLGAAIAARVVAVGNALVRRLGHFLTPYAERFAKQIASLVAHPKANWSPDARGAVLYAFGRAKVLVGQEQAQSASLEAAVAVFREALKEFTRERTPVEWAETQHDLGVVLSILGTREAGTGKLEEALVAFREALKELTRERQPLGWATTQANLGAALGILGQRENGTDRLKESVAASHEALKEFTRKRQALAWAKTQTYLGAALGILGQRENGTGRLKESVAAYREALKELTRERVPLEWATTQLNLGAALENLGEREKGTGSLKAAIRCYREALKELTRERVPLEWATTQNNLGIALGALAERQSGTVSLKAAISAFHEALNERTRRRTPHEWAETQRGLGNALEALGERQSETRNLEAAVRAYREALKEFTRTRAPLQWAATQNGLGNALLILGQRESGTGNLEAAVAAYRDALKEKAAPFEYHGVQRNLEAANALLAQRRGNNSSGNCSGSWLD
jgi:tetratricopeptide (TPR) repeat protein